jgi:hypothetical protein
MGRKGFMEAAAEVWVRALGSCILSTLFEECTSPFGHIQKDDHDHGHTNPTNRFHA